MVYNGRKIVNAVLAVVGGIQISAVNSGIRNQSQRIAIRLGLFQFRPGIPAACAGDIVYDDVHAKFFFSCLKQQARTQIRCSACFETYQDTDILFGPIRSSGFGGSSVLICSISQCGIFLFAAAGNAGGQQHQCKGQ